MEEKKLCALISFWKCKIHNRLILFEYIWFKFEQRKLLIVYQEFIATATRGSTKKRYSGVWMATLDNLTYKIIPRPQSVCAVFFQQTLQKRPGCAGSPRAHHQCLVEDVVIHFVRVSAVEWGLGYETKVKKRHLSYNEHKHWSWDIQLCHSKTRKLESRLHIKEENNNKSMKICGLKSKLTKPNSISYSTEPRHHQSTVLSYGCFLRTSGAKYWWEEGHEHKKKDTSTSTKLLLNALYCSERLTFTKQMCHNPTGLEKS